MFKSFFTLMLMILSCLTLAEQTKEPILDGAIKLSKDMAPQKMSKSKKKEKPWWEKRDVRPDIYYPHKAHYDVMEEEGDSCLLCHSYRKNEVHDEKKRKPLNVISNEALKEICHNCHVTELRGPWRCELCHDDPKKIWPDDHNFGYIQHHSEDARQNKEACRECHLDNKFCSDCHFRRDTSGNDYHPLGYRSLHGIDARIQPSNCARCHNFFYCRDCHQTR